MINYLGKLEEVARLEPCGIHYSEYDTSKAEDDVAHVVRGGDVAERKAEADPGAEGLPLLACARCAEFSHTR